MLRFLLPLALLLPLAIADDCDCYRTSTSQKFTDYSFHDFRNQTGVLAPPPPLPSDLPAGLVPTTADYERSPDIGITQDGLLKSDEWEDSWSVQAWGKNASANFPVRMQNSLSNVYVGALAFHALRIQS